MESVAQSTRTRTIARGGLGAVAFAMALVGAYVVVVMGDLAGGLPLAGLCAIGVLGGAVYARERSSFGAPILWGSAFGVATIGTFVYLLHLELTTLRQQAPLCGTGQGPKQAA